LNIGIGLCGMEQAWANLTPEEFPAEIKGDGEGAWDQRACGMSAT